MGCEGSLSTPGRPKALSALRETLFDLVVIGGGVNGAGIAREAAFRGLKVALLEARDFAYGTSSRSSKLIHGGLRYLAQGEISLVREAARERQVLRRIAPHLAEPLEMLIPAYGRTRTGLVKLAAGLWIFEMLAPVPAEESYRVLDAAAAKAAEPNLNEEGLCGAIVYHEFATEDARLVLDTIKSASDAGAIALNYAPAVAISHPSGGPAIVNVRDAGGARVDVAGRCIVNASGPWLDSVAALEGRVAKTLHLTKGIHLVFRWAELPVSHCVVMQAADRRPVFAVPRGERVYVGTTDTDYDGPLEDPPIEQSDVEYLLWAVRKVFPFKTPAADQVVGGWAGLRPLLHQEGRRPSDISRRDEIIVSPTGLISVAGGKLTTYRAMAERVVKRALSLPQMANVTPSTASHSGTDLRPLSGGDLAGAESLSQYLTEVSATGPLAEIKGGLRKRLVYTYGANAPRVVACADGDPNMLRSLAPGVPLTAAEVRYAINYEGAATVCDVLERRCRLTVFFPEMALAAAEAVAREMGRELGWTGDQVRSEVRGLREHVRRAHLACGKTHAR